MHGIGQRSSTEPVSGQHTALWTMAGVPAQKAHIASLSMPSFVFCHSPTPDLAVQRNMLGRTSASAAMYVIARPGLWLTVHISMSCE